MRNRPTGPLAAAVAVAAGLAACAATEQVPRTAAFEATAETTAVIESIDRQTREVLLRTEDGRFVTVVAGPEVRNFDALQPADRVRAVFTESLVAAVAAPDERAETVVATGAVRAAPGQTPGLAVGEAITSVVEIVSYDPGTALVTFRAPSGKLHSVEVPESMRAFVAGRRPGDRVHVDFVQAFAIGIVPL